MLELYSVSELKEKLQKADRIFIFGVGNRLGLFQEMFLDCNIKNKIRGVIDNSEKLKGNIIKIFNNRYIVCSLEEIMHNITEESIIIVTPDRVYRDICCQLEIQHIMDKCKVVCLTHTIAIEHDINSLNKNIDYVYLNDKQQIPKIIHYCWFGKNSIPDKYKNWMESWKKYCPDYEIIEWNESNYDIKKNKYMRQAYESQKWGSVPDYARIDIINTYGGIYLDTDVELIKNMDDLLYQNCFMGFQQDDLVNLGHGFGSKKDNDILCEMMEEYNKYNFILENGTLNMLPSPYYQTAVLERNGLKLNGEYQIIKGNAIYPEKMLCAKSIYTFVINTKPYTHAIHHFDGSWSDSSNKLYNMSTEKELGAYHLWKK